MPEDRSKQDKLAVLREHATLNPRPDGVTHTLFATVEFFDPHDLLQVKYEMLRLVSVDKRPISEAAKACGFSRPAFYQAQAAFEQGGLACLIRNKPGPHGAHKLTPAVMQFVTEARTADPGVRAVDLAEWVRERFGSRVHPRSIERQLLRKKKTALNSAGTSPARAPRNDGLIVRYEELRRQVLGRYGAHGHGLALLMRRGMSAWMQAWSHCVAAPPVPTQLPDDQQTCPVKLHRELATLLANMALFARQEVIA